MSTTYTKASRDELVHSQLAKVMRKWHQSLQDVEATVDVLWAANDEGPPLKQRGYPCAALVKKTSLKERANGAGDILLIIDFRHYEMLPEPEQLALLDHKLEHLVAVPDLDVGGYKRDDLNRPKLKTLPHDFEVGGFYSVVKRHAEAAAEYRQLQAIQREFVQKSLPFPEPEGAMA